jgi:hypothetical protein
MQRYLDIHATSVVGAPNVLTLESRCTRSNTSHNADSDLLFCSITCIIIHVIGERPMQKQRISGSVAT